MPDYISDKTKRALAAKQPRPEACDICGTHSRFLVLDHCHEHKYFRGWLCRRCNAILGFAKDDPILLRKLAGYLDQARDQQPIVVPSQRDPSTPGPKPKGRPMTGAERQARSREIQRLRLANALQALQAAQSKGFVAEEPEEDLS